MPSQPTQPHHPPARDATEAATASQAATTPASVPQRHARGGREDGAAASTAASGRYRLQPARPGHYFLLMMLGVIVAALIPALLWSATSGLTPERRDVVLTQPGFDFSRQVPDMRCLPASDLMGGYDCGPVVISVFGAFEPDSPQHTMGRALRATHTFRIPDEPVHQLPGGLLTVVPGSEVVGMGFENPDLPGEYLYIILTTHNALVGGEVVPGDASKAMLADAAQRIWATFTPEPLDFDIAGALGAGPVDPAAPLLENFLPDTRQPERV